MARSPRRLEAAARALPRRSLLATRPVRRRDAGEPARRARPEGQRPLDARPSEPALPGLDGDEHGHADRLPLERAAAHRRRRRHRRSSRRPCRARRSRVATGARPRRRLLRWAQDGGLRRRPRTRSPKALERVDEARLVRRRPSLAVVLAPPDACLRRLDGRRSGRPIRCDRRPRRRVRGRRGLRGTRGRRRQQRLLAFVRQDGLPRHGPLRPARRLAGRPLAARHLADREPVGVRPTARRGRSSASPGSRSSSGARPQSEDWCCEG